MNGRYCVRLNAEKMNAHDGADGLRIVVQRGGRKENQESSCTSLIISRVYVHLRTYNLLFFVLV